MSQVLAEEILPALERLRREKGNYMQYQATEATLDRLRRFVHAYQYVGAQKCVHVGSSHMEGFEELKE